MTLANERHYHYIYKITRADGSNKYYIGMHSTNNLEDGYFGSGIYLRKSIKKHGIDAHTKQILEYLPSREALKYRERELVNKELLNDEKCMNLRIGGDGGGGFSSEEHRIKFFKAAKTANQDNNHLKKISYEKRSKQCAKGLTTKQINGTQRNGFLDKSHSFESKNKISQSMRGKNLADKNPQFGTCWIKNSEGSLRIKKEDLQKYLRQGYSKGRSFVQGYSKRTPKIEALE